MPTPIDPRGKDNPSTYFVQSQHDEAEMIRLLLQDQFITAGMGGVLAEQQRPETFQRVLDVACGPGGWVLETAAHYPTMQITGIDISWRMIEYARAQAQARRLSRQIDFQVMDAMRPLEFADDTFDLVNMRFASSFLHLKEWSPTLRELLRVTRPGGTVRITESGSDQTGGPTSNSQVYERMLSMLLCAGEKAGYSDNPRRWGVAHRLDELLTAAGCQQVQMRPYRLEFVAGTATGESIYQDAMYTFQNTRPLIDRWGCGSPDYQDLYQQMLVEMQQPGFHVFWNLSSAWGIKASAS
jgi:ubiquinone/menaquinone biosynthesis C-methylase UbiE